MSRDDDLAGHGMSEPSDRTVTCHTNRKPATDRYCNPTSEILLPGQNAKKEDTEYKKDHLILAFSPKVKYYLITVLSVEILLEYHNAQWDSTT